MQGNGMEVGNVGEVFGNIWCGGDAAGGDDGEGAVRERQRHVLSGCGTHDCNRSIQPRRYGVSV
jgi:hypothetical protein